MNFTIRVIPRAAGVQALSQRLLSATTAIAEYAGRPEFRYRPVDPEPRPREPIIVPVERRATRLTSFELKILRWQLAGGRERMLRLKRQTYSDGARKAQARRESA